MARFLDSFGGVADEIIVVEARGAAPPDNSMAIALERGCVTGRYCNRNHREWDHVDDFAAARQEAFDLATGDFVMWADLDDVFCGEPGKVRELCGKLPEKCKGLMLPYKVPEDGVEVMRERVIRKGAAVWRNAVHECLDFGGKAELGENRSVHLLHKPHGEDRGGNDERNLRILESLDREALSMSHRFHLFQSLRAVGRVAEATELAIETVKMPEIGKPEKFELLISLGQLTEDEAQRGQFFLQALATDPARREGYGELGIVSLTLGDPEASLGWIKAMMGIPKPRDLTWNARRKYYGYLAEQLHSMALRANHRHEEADAIDANVFIRAGRRISLLHATRGRPNQAVKTRATWFDRADHPEAIEHIFCIDPDDRESAALGVYRCLYNMGTGSVGAWNTAADAAGGEVLVQLSDDWRPPRGWDTAILEAVGDADAPKVLAVSDGARRDDLLCMAILTRKRYEQQGWVFHPDFFSVYSDNWFSELAWADGVVIDAREKITFEHMHPAFGKGEMDETYSRCNGEEHYAAGKRHLERLQAGCITSYEVHGWCNFRAFYSEVARRLEDGDAFVEVGSWMGQSMIHMAQRCQDLGKTPRLVCVDTFQGEEGQEDHIPIVEKHGGSIRKAFDENVARAGVAEMLDVREGFSVEMAAEFGDGELAGVFIDAAHDYDNVVADLAAWVPKVRKGGVISGHDYNWHEVKRAVDEAADRHGWEIKVMGNTWLAIEEEK